MFHCPKCHNEEDFLVDATGTRVLALRCHKGDYEIRDETDVDVVWTRVMCVACGHETTDALARESYDQATRVTCRFCDDSVPLCAASHAHQGGWVGPCCFDERLASPTDHGGRTCKEVKVRLALFVAAGEGRQS
jgi:hypothetical protein